MTIKSKRKKLAGIRHEDFRANMLLCSTALAAVLAVPSFAQAQGDAELLEEVTVTGIRASMAAASDMKRNDSRIVDAIVAEDIGKLPDNNIAEALQRITGVSISSDFGIGESVSIRGMTQNRIEMNGRTTLGDDRDGVSLDDIPASFLQAIEVVKSPTADMIEGALGGTVNMITRKPLDLDGFTAAGSFDQEYSDKTENWAPIFNASVGNVWDLGDAGTFGVMGMVSYQDREIRQDEFKNRVRLYDEDVNGLTANTPSGRFAVREQNTVEQYVQNQERSSANVIMQWAPASERGSVYLDVSYSERSGEEAGSSILDVGGSRVYNANTTQDSGGQVSNYTLEGAFVIPKTWSEFRETESWTNAFGGSFDLTDQITLSGEVSIASSESSEPASEFNLRPVNKTNWQTWSDQYTPGVSDYDDDRSAFGLRHTVDATMVGSGGSVPGVVYSDPNALLDPENLAIRAFRHDDVTTENDETAYRFDMDYENAFGFESVKSLKVGFRFTENDYKYNLNRFRTPDLYKGVTTDTGTAAEKPYTVWIDEFEQMYPGTFETVNHNDSFGQHGFSGQNDLTSYRIYKGSLLSDASGTFERIKGMLAGTSHELTGSLSDNWEVQEGAFRDISEETTAFYVSADMAWMEGRLRATVGARYVETEVESTVYENGVKVTGDHSYDDVLPSVNISYDLRDDTVLRFAAGKVMRRADYNELSPAFEVNGGIYAADQGALDLDPYRATQYDISVEHYWGTGNMVSFAVFYKDVESFLKTENTCRSSGLTSAQEVTEWEAICLLNSAGVDNSELQFSTLGDFAGGVPDADTAGFNYTQAQRDAGLTGINTSRVTNGENGSVEGIEIGYQHSFDFLPDAWSGLGVSANYTYAKSEQPNGNMLKDISENTVNVQLFWEYSDYQIRLAYNYRDEFLAEEEQEEVRIQTVGGLGLNSSTNDETSPNYDPTAGNSYQEARGQFDLSMAWDISENLTLVGNIVNLTEEPVSYATELGSTWYYTEADRRFSLGIRGKF